MRWVERLRLKRIPEVVTPIGGRLARTATNKRSHGTSAESITPGGGVTETLPPSTSQGRVPPPMVTWHPSLGPIITPGLGDMSGDHDE